MYNVIRVLQDVKLRGTDQQVNNELLARGAQYSLPGHPQQLSGATVPSIPVYTDFYPRGAMAIKSYSLQNRSASIISMGIGFKLRNDQWKAGFWTDATPAFADDSYDAKSSVASDFPMETAGTNNDGFVILSSVKWDWLSINVGTANVASSSRACRYSNAAGTGWVDVPAAGISLDELTGSGDTITTGENLFVWTPPQDWGKVTVLSGITGDGYYAFNCRSTLAPATTAASATAIEIGTLPILVDSVGSGGTISDAGVHIWEPYGDAIVAFFSVANAGNRVSATWVHAG